MDELNFNVRWIEVEYMRYQST